MTVKRLIVDVTVDDVDEGEILSRVDDVLGDCALGPADFTDLALDPDTVLDFSEYEDEEPEDIAQSISGQSWVPPKGSALDYIYNRDGKYKK